MLVANIGLGRHEHEQDDGAEPRVRDDAAVALLQAQAPSTAPAKPNGSNRM
jgi:hypothetical protein